MGRRLEKDNASVLRDRNSFFDVGRFNEILCYSTGKSHFFECLSEACQNHQNSTQQSKN